MESLLGWAEVHLSLEVTKDKWASIQLLRRTVQVIKYAVDKTYKIEMILGKIAEWMGMIRYTYMFY